MKGSVRKHGSKWQYRFRGPERDSSSGQYPWITKGGFDTEKAAWQACREAMRQADRGRVVEPSARTVAQFFTDWFVAIEPSIDATTWQNWKDYASSYVLPRIGAEHLQSLDAPALLRLYATLLADSRVKRDSDYEMHAYWAERVANDESSTAREVSEACHTTIHAARAAVRLLAGLLWMHFQPGRVFSVSARSLTGSDGKVFTGRFHHSPVEVLFDAICRQHGIEHLLTQPRSRPRRARSSGSTAAFALNSSATGPLSRL
jgi:hypothetical protein